MAQNEFAPSLHPTATDFTSANEQSHTDEDIGHMKPSMQSLKPESTSRAASPLRPRRVTNGLEELVAFSPRKKIVAYDEFISSESPRRWLDRAKAQQIKGSKDASQAEIYAKKHLESVARKIDGIDKRLDLTVKDSAERAHIARDSYHRTRDVFHSKRDIDKMEQIVLSEKEADYRKAMHKEYRPIFHQELEKLQESSTALSYRTSETLKKSWLQSLERRIKIEIERKRGAEWSPEKIRREAIYRLNFQKEQEKIQNSVRDKLFTAPSTGRLASIVHQVKAEKQTGIHSLLTGDFVASISSLNLAPQNDSSRGSFDMNRESIGITSTPSKPRYIASTPHFSSSGSLQIRLEPIHVQPIRVTIPEVQDESESAQ